MAKASPKKPASKAPVSSQKTVPNAKVAKTTPKVASKTPKTTTPKSTVKKWTTKVTTVQKSAPATVVASKKTSIAAKNASTSQSNSKHLSDKKTTKSEKSWRGSLVMTVVALAVILWLVGVLYTLFIARNGSIQTLLPSLAKEDAPVVVDTPVDAAVSDNSSDAQPSNDDIYAMIEHLSTVLFIESWDILESARVIQDITQVQPQNPEFFKNAANGDYIFFFQSRIILYRASTQQIINMLPIDPSTRTPAEPEAMPPT